MLRIAMQREVPDDLILADLYPRRALITDQRARLARAPDRRGSAEMPGKPDRRRGHSLRAPRFAIDLKVTDREDFECLGLPGTGKGGLECIHRDQRIPLAGDDKQGRWLTPSGKIQKFVLRDHFVTASSPIGAPLAPGVSGSSGPSGRS